MGALDSLARNIIRCRKCPRLVRWREQVGKKPPRRFQGEKYWGKPLVGFGDAGARLLIVGLAPAAHGGNRTGRMFTGDRSGDWLYRVLHRTGFASQAESVSRTDGLTLDGAYVTASVRCAPPDNKPLPEEIRNCRPYLERELALLTDLKVVVALGKIAFDNYLEILKSHRKIGSRAPYRFGHGCEYRTGEELPALIASYHPSQQNTSTGK